MKIENRVYPDPEQMAPLQEGGPDGPIVMVNLLRFRETAREAGLEGQLNVETAPTLGAQLPRQP